MRGTKGGGSWEEEGGGAAQAGAGEHGGAAGGAAAGGQEGRHGHRGNNMLRLELQPNIREDVTRRRTLLVAKVALSFMTISWVNACFVS